MNTNRFNAGQGFGYDKNGNIVSNIDPMTSQARTFLFNADNKQYEVKNAFGATTARYYYDGEGKRVKKKVYDPNNPSVVSEETIFVYSSGKLVAEYSTVTPPATPTVNYTTTDHLGSPRVITDAIGQVNSRRDFLPFGEEVTINVGAPSTALKYGSSDDKVRQKFTGYQKDTETSLDFAEARMYDNRFGRFTAVDPLLTSGKSINPQTFNRYVYGGNNPVFRTDPNGEDWYVAFSVMKNGRFFMYPKWCPSNCAAEGFEKRWGREHSIKVGKRDINYNFPFVFQITSGEDVGKFIGLDPFSADKTAPTTLEKAVEANREFIIRAYKNAAIAGMDEISLTFYFARKLAGIEANEDHDMYKIGSRFGQAYFWVSVGAAGGIGIAAGIAKLGEKGAGKLFGSLAKTFSKYPSCSGMCTKAADEALSAFKKAGIEGEIVRLTDSAGAHYLFDAAGNPVAQTKFHDVVRVGDRYFDALTQEAGLLTGATWDQYIKLWDSNIQWVKGTR